MGKNDGRIMKRLIILIMGLVVMYLTGVNVRFLSADEGVNEYKLVFNANKPIIYGYYVDKDENNNIDNDVIKNQEATVKENESITIKYSKDKLPTLKNYVFAGISKNRQASGLLKKDYKLGTDYSVTISYDDIESRDYYIYWIKTYSLQFYVNDGESENIFDKVTVPFISDYDAIYSDKFEERPSSYKFNYDKIPTRKGYTFDGWTEERKENVYEEVIEGEYYSRAREYTSKDEESVTLYASWTPNDYNIKYDANGGDVYSVPETDTVEYNSEYVISKTVPKRTGYSFKGWSSDKSGTVIAVSNGKYVTAGDTILYAIWEANQYNVIYDCNGGMGVSISDKALYGAEYSVASSIPTKNGYEFLGWALDNITGKVSYAAGQKISSYNTAEDITLYAVWKVRDIDIVTYTQPSNRQVIVTWTATNETSEQTYEITLDGVVVANGIKTTSYVFNNINAGNHTVNVVAVNGMVKSQGKSVDFNVKTELTIKSNGKSYVYMLDSSNNYVLPNTHKQFVSTYPNLVAAGYIFDGFYGSDGKVVKNISDHTAVTIKWRSINLRLTKTKVSKGVVKLIFSKIDWDSIDGYKISYSLDSHMKKNVKNINVKKGKKNYYLFSKAKSKLKNGGVYYFSVRFYYKNSSNKRMFFKGSGVKKWIRYYKN